MPDPDNRVTLTPDGQIQLIYHRDRNNVAAFEQLKQKLKDLFEKLGTIDPDLKTTYWNGYDLGISGVSHQCGTLRFGHDPAMSVPGYSLQSPRTRQPIRGRCQLFSLTGAYNPSLTTAANALRVGDYLLNGLR